MARRLENNKGKTPYSAKKLNFMVLSILVTILILITIFAPLLTPYDALKADIGNGFQPPSSEHFMGTDRLGRDVFSRVILASRISIPATLSLVLIILIVGTFLGVISGYFCGITDTVIMRIADMMISFPGMVLAIAVAGFMGASITNSIIAIALVSWSKYARLARSLVLKIRHEEFVEAAITTGSSNTYILSKYMLPNILPTMVVTAASDVGGMMLELAGLSFLGFGAQPPNPEWGLMLSEGREFFTARPWLIMYPGIAIVIVVSVFNLWGDSLRNVLDPKYDN